MTSARRSGVHSPVWLKPLDADWKATLTREEAQVLGTAKPLYCDGDRAQREFARSSCPDGCRGRRIAAMGQAWHQHPGKPLPVIFPRPAGQKATYRLLSNERVKVKRILEPHFEATVDRCRQERFVLAIQDTTTLNYTNLLTTEGLDKSGVRLADTLYCIPSVVRFNSIGLLAGYDVSQ